MFMFARNRRFFKRNQRTERKAREMTRRDEKPRRPMQADYRNRWVDEGICFIAETISVRCVGLSIVRIQHEDHPRTSDEKWNESRLRSELENLYT